MKSVAGSKRYFLGSPERMDSAVLRQAEETKHVLCNDENLDKVSRVSALTPKSKMSKVTYVSDKTKLEDDKITTVSKQSKLSKQSTVSKSTTMSTK